MVRELGTYREEFFTGSATHLVLQSVEGLIQSDVVRRLWAIDPGLFTHDADSAKGIPQRMGWLRSPEFMGGHAAALKAYARQVAEAGIRKVVVLSIGGTAAVVRALVGCFGARRGFPEVRLLDDVEPALVKEIGDWVDVKRTLVVVSAKDGENVELQSLVAYFWDKLHREIRGETGLRFVAVTDPESFLQRTARRDHYARVFENPPDMGERYTPISFYGMLPAALMGVDVEAFIEDSKRMGDACSPAVAIEQNPGFKLGSFIVGLARAGRDKVTLLLPDRLRPFGAWIEHMLAESTAKRGRGIFPVVGEPIASVGAYSADRSFVHLRLAVGKRDELDELVDSLIAGGHPVARIAIGDMTELGGEFFRWEMATAIIASYLRVNPFDEPGLAASRNATASFLEAHRQDSVLPRWRSAPPTDQALVELVRKLKPGDYLAIAAYFPANESRDRLFTEMRGLIRDKFRVATAQGYGAPFLYSTGQLHKNGPSNAALVMLTATPDEDVAVPEHWHSFGVLRDAMALGDLQLLEHSQRRALRIHLGEDVDGGLETMRDKLKAL